MVKNRADSIFKTTAICSGLVSAPMGSNDFVRNVPTSATPEHWDLKGDQYTLVPYTDPQALLKGAGTGKLKPKS